MRLVLEVKNQVIIPKFFLKKVKIKKMKIKILLKKVRNKLNIKKEKQ